MKAIAALFVTALALAAVPGGTAQPQDARDPGREARKRLFRDRFLDHFMLGVEAPGEWLRETLEKNGCRWDAQVGYLSGGAAKEEPWWLKYSNHPAVRIKECKAVNAVTWFTWYLLADSAPAHYKPGPAQATPVNAKVTATMRSYFELFKRLMQICGEHAPHPCAVQIEPDEWGHLLLSAGMDPARVDVKVGSTGMEELKGLPDNLFGWAAAFKRLRDLYAPTNVLLGCNPSGWDWRGSLSGKNFGRIIREVAPDYDFAVFETGDRDKGMHGKAPPYGEQSGICETFDNHIAWIRDFHEATGLHVFVWQVAMGNTHFATCNNTPGHYCDNLAQKILEDYPRNDTIARYVQAGCAGWMFNAGQGDSTHVYDHRKDGITNPPPIAGNLGNTSEHPDDDGGYLRLRAAAYYKKPFPILGKAPAGGSAASGWPSPFKPKPAAEPGGPAKAEGAGGAAEAKPPAPQRKPASPEALKEWDERLQASLQAKLQAGTKPRFVFPAVGGPAEVAALDARGEMKVIAAGSSLCFAWKQLPLDDKRALAIGLASSDAPSDLALAAFYCLATGHEKAAEPYWRRLGEPEREAVNAAFR